MAELNEQTLTCGLLRFVDAPDGKKDPLGNAPQVVEVCTAEAGHPGDHTWTENAGAK